LEAEVKLSQNEKKPETSNTIDKSLRIILTVILIDVLLTMLILFVPQISNENLFQLINLNISFGILDPIMALIANFGAVLLLLFSIIIFLFSSKSSSKYALLITIGGFWISLFLGYSLKTYFNILRPYELISYTRTLIFTPEGLGDAFPSSHALIAFFVWTIISVKAKKYRYPALFLAVITSFSRIYVGVHFPLDITVGALLGIIVASILLLFEKIFIDYKQRILVKNEN
jgi:undecaprenyl-diphosphatase